MGRGSEYSSKKNKHRILDSVGEGEGGMTWENGIETCLLSCKN